MDPRPPGSFLDASWAPGSPWKIQKYTKIKKSEKNQKNILVYLFIFLFGVSRWGHVFAIPYVFSALASGCIFGAGVQHDFQHLAPLLVLIAFTALHWGV